MVFQERCAGEVPGYSSVDRFLALGPRFPTTVNPEPLARMLADHVLQQRMQAAGVIGGIAGHGDGRVKAQDVAALLAGPQSESGDNGGAGSRGDLSKRGVGAGGRAEEVDEDAFLERGILIDQDADRLVLLQRAQDGARAIPLL